jgi:hypothetical protein
MSEINGLNKVNSMVLKRFRKASDVQKVQMIRILREQLDNLKLLLTKMETEFNYDDI